MQVLVVTPEATQLDVQAKSLAVPLIDGEAGILDNHSPMIGQLAPGELRVETGSTTSRYYVDGGFVQVANNVVSVLTGRCITFDKIDVAHARKLLEETKVTAADSSEVLELKNKTLAQARAQLRLSGNG